jgi:hypothetical protein
VGLVRNTRREEQRRPQPIHAGAGPITPPSLRGAPVRPATMERRKKALVCPKPRDGPGGNDRARAGTILRGVRPGASAQDDQSWAHRRPLPTARATRASSGRRPRKGWGVASPSDGGPGERARPCASWKHRARNRSSFPDARSRHFPQRTDQRPTLLAKRAVRATSGENRSLSAA